MIKWDFMGCRVGLPNPRRVPLLVLFCGALSLALYALLPAIVRTMASGVPSHAWELFPWLASCTGESLHLVRERAPFALPELSFFGVYAGLFAVYAFMVWLMREAQSVTLRALVFGGGALFLAAFLFSPVMLSSDTYAYGFYGRLVSMYGGDAYGGDSNPVTSDAFLTLYGHNAPSIYGPFWTLISAGVTWLAGDRVGLTLLLFRGVAAGSVLLGAGLIWSCLRKLAPERALQGVAFFLWNPLVITEAGLSGHNDAAMMVLVLLAIWLHVKGYRVGAVVALTLSALVKFVTGPLLPLYLLMTLRESAGWGDRFRLTVRALLAAAVATGLTLALAHVRENATTQQYATAPDFYSNNFHELIFKGLRRALGEDEELVNVPIYFAGWWIKSATAMELRATPESTAPSRCPVKEGARLLVLAPPQGDWVRVYDPPSRQNGYVNMGQTSTTAAPADSEADPLASELENGPMEWPTVLKANGAIRIVTCLLFAAFGLFAAWRTADFDRFLLWAPAAVLAMYFTVTTQIWPWYLIWALALAALKPGSAPFKLAAMLSAGMMTLYSTISFDNGDWPWVFQYRSFPAVVIPAVGFAIYYAAGKWRARGASPVAETITELPEEMPVA